MAAVASCARQGMPPGGPEDRRPPVVVATVPDTFAVLTEPFRGPVEFLFDERISERASSGTLAQAVVVSPRTGEVRVESGRQSIKVSMGGGFQPGQVYRVTLLPAVRDLFNNQLLAPFELVFSTGPAFNASAVAGTAWDRTTGEGLDAMEVLAIPQTGGDSTVHVARTDTSGVYVFRYLPPAPYRLVAYQDRNRNAMVDPMELQGEAALEVTGADTLFVDVPVLQPDTTPARLTRAQVLDSVTVVLEFDDFLDPEARSDLLGVTVVHEESGEGARVDVFHERDYVAWIAQLQDSFTRLDSLEAARRAEDALEDVPLSGDTAQVDTVAAVPLPAPAAPAARAARTTRPLPPALPAATGGGRPAAPRMPGGSGAERLTPDGRPLPARRLVLRVDPFLEVNQGYRASAAMVVNINGLAGGGGEAAVIREPPPDTTSADTLQTDTLGVDSLAVPDTVPPDTVALPPDTIPSPAGRRGVWAFLPERRR